VCPNIAVVYNQPDLCHCSPTGEEKAELGVLEEVDAVHQALSELNYTVTRVPLLPPLEQAREKINALNADLVFNLFEGFNGYPETEAIIADMLAETGLQYTGCPGSALALALDKARVKGLLKTSGINTPCWQVISPDTLHFFNLTFPCIVKPLGEDASHGLSVNSVVKDSASLEKQVLKMSQLYGGKALVERFIDGREFNTTVIGNSELGVLPISEISYSLPPGVPKILTFASKWESQSIDYQCTKVICPATIHTRLRKEIIKIAMSTYRLIGCRGYARLDLRLNAEEQPEVIEVNPNPDISPGAGVARQAQAAGMTYNELIEKILLFALGGEWI